LFINFTLVINLRWRDPSPLYVFTGTLSQAYSHYRPCGWAGQGTESIHLYSCHKNQHVSRSSARETKAKYAPRPPSNHRRHITNPLRLSCLLSFTAGGKTRLVQGKICHKKKERKVGKK